ncbi:hypothetical protein DFP72DRAFT_819855 [Ephemerocybe angulata]|uniref:Uncharacterized protein n=1 Tax=Ephemerocybe angulata TaxID=980116 RepID=A0A8H6HLV3_9AGAR|nr:hypothetical protein DFP72DRAFT_819855 [Tulosesus angulatus]
MDSHPEAITLWENPATSFAYSRGEPKSGFSKLERYEQVTEVLKDDTGRRVKCQVSYDTCTWIYNLKILRKQREEDRSKREAFNAGAGHHGTWNLNAQVCQKTVAFFCALMETGCGFPRCEPTVRTGEEKRRHDAWTAQINAARRGHIPKETCDGRLILCKGRDNKPYIRCEHYSSTHNRDHRFDWSPSEDIYDLKYLEALFDNNRDALKDIEEDLELFHNLGPLAPCSYTMNNSSVRVHCPSPHRGSDGLLVKAEMANIGCAVKFRVYRPAEREREKCPRVLVISMGEHTHGIPALTKTPPHVANEMRELLNLISDDLADLTPRRLIRHPVTLAYLKQKFPKSDVPLLSDIHPSLANRDHLRIYIDPARERKFPFGTGFAGLQHIKSLQDSSHTTAPYIRTLDTMINFSEILPGSEEGDIGSHEICLLMTPESSRQLLKTRFIATDISFKRVAGRYLEFALGVMDTECQMSRVLARAFVTSESAAMHALLFRRIAETVKLDTGEDLKWRHLHARTPDELIGICMISVDQHRGQAKGIGAYLQEVARNLPRTEDLHEPRREIQDLSEYDHLRRIMRLCTIHLARNIQKTGAPDNIKKKMKSLICVSHDSWDETIAEIRQGGTAANNWINDKISSGFAFPAMCWEKSFIPKAVWDYGHRTTNVVESSHADVNREGISLSLVGAYATGYRFDVLKEKTAEALVQHGVKHGYSEQSAVQIEKRKIKRKAEAVHSQHEREDIAISQHNKRIRTEMETLARSNERLQEAIIRAPPASALGTMVQTPMVERANNSVRKSQARLSSLEESSRALVGTGSRRIKATMPPTQ